MGLHGLRRTVKGMEMGDGFICVIWHGDPPTLWNYVRCFSGVIGLFSRPQTSRTQRSAHIMSVIGGGECELRRQQAEEVHRRMGDEWGMAGPGRLAHVLEPCYG